MDNSESFETKQLGAAVLASSPQVQVSSSAGVSNMAAPMDQGGNMAGRGPLGIRLKPCEVCGDKSTGYHFGVISCEACKSFFRRSLKRGGEYFCEKGGNCPPTARGNSSCPACRLKRCRMVGMSPHAVKKGRYSHEKRAETIIQSRMYWENLQQQQQESSTVTPLQGQIVTDTGFAAAWSAQQNFKMYKEPNVNVQIDGVASQSATGSPALFIPYTEPTPTYTNNPTVVYGGENTEGLVYVEAGQEFTTTEVPEVNQISEANVESEVCSLDCIDYSRLGPSAKDLIIDGHSISSDLKGVLNQLHNNNKTDSADSSKSNSESTMSDVCQLQIDGLPLSQLFQSFLPHLQNGAGQKMLEQYQQLSAQLSREKCMSFLQSMQQVQQQSSSAISQNVGVECKNSDKSKEENALFDLHETAETLINLAKYPVEKKAVVVEMIPQTGVLTNEETPVLACPPVGHASSSESLPLDIFEFTQEDKDLIAECSSPITDTKELEEIEKLINETFESVEKTKFISDEVASAIPDIQKKFLEKRSEREKTFGQMGPISSTEYLQIYRRTELDVDGRTAVLNRDANLMERVVLMFVKLYRSFPGYNNLPIEDQASVLKGTKVDVGYMMNTKLVNVKEQLLTSQFLDITYDMNYFKSFASEETVLQTFQVAERVQSLDLNNLETAIAAAFVAMQPDVCKTEEGRRLCEQQRKNNMKALYQVLCKERSEQDSVDIIKEILALLKQLRVQEDMLSGYWDKFFQDYDNVNFPKCFMEMYKK